MALSRHPYGSDPSQFGDLYLPAAERARGTIVVIHGGFWRAGYALDLGAPISTDLAARGFAVWNLEYRRLGNGGGWPATFRDVAAGVAHLVKLDVDLEKVVTIGHSAGGQLATWVAGRSTADALGATSAVRVSGVVSQSGVLDLATAARIGLGDGAATELLGGTPATVPERYAAVDPVQRLPLAAPVRCVHGRADTTVPLTQSEAYVDAARAAGGDAELVDVPGDHFALIDPSTPAWDQTVSLLPALLGG